MLRATDLIKNQIIKDYKDLKSNENLSEANLKKLSLKDIWKIHSLTII